MARKKDSMANHILLGCPSIIFLFLFIKEIIWIFLYFLHEYLKLLTKILNALSNKRKKKYLKKS